MRGAASRVRVLAQPVVQDDDAQAVQQLSLVLVDALDLAVEDRARIDGDVRGRFQPVRETRLGLRLGLADGVAKARIVGERLQPGEVSEVGDPAVADRLGDAAGQGRVGQQEPAPRRHAVGLVVEALGKQVGQVLHGHGTQQARMDGGDAVGAVRAHDGEVGHPDVAIAALLDEAHLPGALALVGKPRPHLIQETLVDIQDDLEMARQHQLEPSQRPFLQRLGQQRVVGVGERAPGDIPGLVPSEAGVVEQDAHQLGNGQARMGVVELDRGLVGQRAPVGIVPPEAAHEIGERAGDQEIFLHEAQASSHDRRIVGIEDPGHRVRPRAAGRGRSRTRRR